MAYFPKLGPFYDPANEQEFYGEDTGRLRLRNSPRREESSHDQRQRLNTSEASKVEGGWSNFVQEHGNLFYVEVDPSSDPQFQHQPLSDRRELNNNHHGGGGENHNRRQATHRQEYNNTYAKIHGYGQNTEQRLVPNGSGHREGVARYSRNILNSDRRTKNLSDDSSGQSDASGQDGYRDSNQSSYSKYLDSDSENSNSTRTALHLSQDSYTGVSNQGIGKPGKRKSFHLLPNIKGIDNMHSHSGVVLCEKLFGVILYQYNQRPPRPNGSNIEQLLRERKVIVQGVIPNSPADACGQIYRGDMLVGLNDIDVTWVNIDDIFKLVSNQKVKLTFQVPLVIGPKLPTPPHTPTRTTPPLPPHLPATSRVPTPPVNTHPTPPPHIPLNTHPTPPPHIPLNTHPTPPHILLNTQSTPTSYNATTAHQAKPNSTPTNMPRSAPPRPPPLPRRKPQEQNLVAIATGESLTSITNGLHKHLCAVMYLRFAGETEDAKEDIVYQFPQDDNKIMAVRGLYLTLSSMMVDVTRNSPKLTTVTHKGAVVHAAYWKEDRDVFLVCLPADRVPSFYLLHILSDILQILKVLFGSVARVFQNSDYHGQLNQLVALALHRVLMRGVMTLTIQPASPLEPLLLDMVTGVRWLHLTQDNKVLCDEILSEFEAADFAELEEEEKDERRMYAILGSCLFFKDYLLCSHLFADDLLDIHLFLKYHSILNLVNKQSLEDLVIWREVFLTRLCHKPAPDNPGYREPKGRRFLLVVGVKHFLLCMVLEAGSYASQMSGKPGPDPFYVDQAKATLIQLETEDVDLEQCCQDRLLSETTGPQLQSPDAERQTRKNSRSEDTVSPLKSQTRSSPRHRSEDDGDRMSQHGQSHAGGDMSAPVMIRQGSKMSYGSNDSTGSGSSHGVLKGKQVNRMGSVYDMASLNRSFSEREISKTPCNIKLMRGQDNTLYHYVCFDCIQGLFVSPSPFDVGSNRGMLHHHILYNFYASAVRIHNKLRSIKYLKSPESEGSIWPGGGNCCWEPVKEEGVMFSCQTVQSDQKKPVPALSYWVLGRLFPGDKEMFVCFQDGTSHTAVEIAFNFSFGLL